MDIIEAMRTLRAMRRLDPDRPVSDEDIWFILDCASKAASGGNRQPLRYLVLKDKERKAAIGKVYRDSWFEDVRAGYFAGGVIDDVTAKNMKSADHLAEHFADSPAIIAVCARQTKDGPPLHMAEVYPAVQNLLLAARSIGLGTTLTTAYWARMDDAKAALEIPDEFRVFALVPVGYPMGRWGEAKRRPVEEVIYWDQWHVRRKPDVH